MKNKKLLLITTGFVVLIGVVILILIKTGSLPPPETPEGVYFTFFGNLHTHTTDSDGEMTYEEVIEKAKALGFDFIAITDHNLISSTVSSFCPIEKRIFCIIGEEVTSSEGHILAIGIENPILQGLSAKETIKMIHEQGGIAIIAHPGRSLGVSIEKAKELKADAVECNPSTKDKNYNYSCELLPEFPRVYNSDAHKEEQLDNVANRCRLTGLSVEALKEAIKRGDCFEFDPAVKYFYY